MAAGAGEEKNRFQTQGVLSLAGLPASCSGKAAQRGMSRFYKQTGATPRLSVRYRIYR